MKLLNAFLLFSVLSCTTLTSPVPRPNIPLCISNGDGTCVCVLDEVSYEKDCTNHISITVSELQEILGYELDLISSCKKWRK